jgi:hypothetical protein
MLRKPGIALLLLMTGFGIVFAEPPELPKMPAGFEVNLNLDADLFELQKIEKSDMELRKEAGRNVGQTVAWPFSNFNWNGDTNLFITYNGGFFGGAFGLCAESPADNYMVKVSTARAWVKPFGGFVKITGGLDIPANYADSLDADPGMRIYNGNEQAEWDHSRDPDNITQDEGILLEGFVGPVTLALAGRYYLPTLFTKSLNPSDPPETQNTKYTSMEQKQYSFGARVGSEIGEWGKVNASYIIEYSNATGENYAPNRDHVLVPTTGDAEITSHLFGLYASLTPLQHLGVSLGYNGIITRYVDQVYRVQDMHDITLPVIFRQAVNLNLRYRGIPRWTFRTDNNVSFWTDRNYTIFGFSAPKDMGIVPESQSAGYADVDHFLIWNGLGVGYQLTETVKLELYARNLYRRDIARDFDDEEILFTRNKIFGELKGIWQPNDALELSVGLVLENQLTVISEDANKRLVGGADGFGMSANVKETKDSVFVVRIPLKMIIKMF